MRNMPPHLKTRSRGLAIVSPLSAHCSGNNGLLKLNILFLFVVVMIIIIIIVIIIIIIMYLNNVNDCWFLM